MREKLIELLCQATFGVNKQTIKSYLPPSAIAEVADHLIANGVTVQDSKVVEIDQFNKWIHVTERLPEPFVSVLVQMPGEKPFPTVREGFISNDGIWQSAMFRREPGEVTHWQPMPQPPKGE